MSNDRTESDILEQYICSRCFRSEDPIFFPQVSPPSTGLGPWGKAFLNLCIGDLGVQRGMLRWFLSLHSEAHPFTLSPEKVNTTGRKAEDSAKDILPELPSSTAAAKGVAGWSEHLLVDASKLNIHAPQMHWK